MMVLGQATPDPSLVARLLETIDFRSILAALSVGLVAYLASRLVTGTLDRIAERSARHRFAAKHLASIVRIAIFLCASYVMILLFLRGNEAVLLGVGGTVLVAAGLSLKSTVSSVVSGILILVDRPFQVGDRIRFEDVYGEVTAIGLRSVQLFTLDGNTVTIPNNRFLTAEVASSSAGTLDAMVVMDFHIAATADHELAAELVYESCASSRYAHLEKSVDIRLSETESAAGLSTVVSCKAYVVDARYERAFETDVTERVRRAFRRHDIQRPYLQTYELPSVG